MQDLEQKEKKKYAEFHCVIFIRFWFFYFPTIEARFDFIFHVKKERECRFDTLLVQEFFP